MTLAEWVRAYLDRSSTYMGMGGRTDEEQEPGVIGGELARPRARVGSEGGYVGPTCAESTDAILDAKVRGVYPDRRGRRGSFFNRSEAGNEQSPKLQ